MRRTASAVALALSLLATAHTTAGAGTCQEDMDCWRASTMGNRTGWEQGVWYESGQPTDRSGPDDRIFANLSASTLDRLAVALADLDSAPDEGDTNTVAHPELVAGEHLAMCDRPGGWTELA